MTEPRDLVGKIHSTPQRAVVAVAGAGSQAVAWLLDVAGASRTLLEVLVPYGSKSMVDFLGQEPDQYVSVATAEDMARSAYRRAQSLREEDYPVLGLGCTATIATDRPKRGEHRCHIAVWDDDRVATYTLVLDKGYRDRAGEEDVVSRLVLQALAEACGIEPDLPVGLTGGDKLDSQTREHGDPVSRLLAGDASTVLVSTDGSMKVDRPTLAKPAALLPGSFSPFHHGHAQLAECASEILGTKVVYELSVVNVDKPQLAQSEVISRLSQFADKGSVVLTRAETFRKKADLFPGSTFVIGWDTAVRLVAPRYYGGESVAMLTALAEIWALGCRFLVAGRRDGETFRTLDDVPVPQGFQPLFQAIPESEFRADISSTALREQAAFN
ncbi:MAG: hypothetical protein IIC96_04420 [Chloroflexi bacterium]|nr:hypothetical protein [Chloroflexota bacterium]